MSSSVSSQIKSYFQILYFLGIVGVVDPFSIYFYYAFLILDSKKVFCLLIQRRFGVSPFMEGFFTFLACFFFFVF